MRTSHELTRGAPGQACEMTWIPVRSRGIGATSCGSRVDGAIAGKACCMPAAKLASSRRCSIFCLRQAATVMTIRPNTVDERRRAASAGDSARVGWRETDGRQA